MQRLMVARPTHSSPISHSIWNQYPMFLICFCIPCTSGTPGTLLALSAAGGCSGSWIRETLKFPCGSPECHRTKRFCSGSALQVNATAGFSIQSTQSVRALAFTNEKTEQNARVKVPRTVRTTVLPNSSIMQSCPATRGCRGWRRMPLMSAPASVRALFAPRADTPPYIYC